jgi:molybdopterin-guanine dinucleotide biosynthesis protein A
VSALRESRFAEVGAALLLGGASRRMGRDKAAVAVGGVPLALRLARLLDDLFEDVLLVGGAPPPDAPGRPVPDVEGPRCALRGLVAALEAARAPRVLVLATDLVGLTPDLLLALLALPEADAVVPETRGGLEPLCALYRRDTVLPVARESLAAGRLAVRELFDAIELRRLSGADLAAVDPTGVALLNANTPEELAHAEARLRAADGGTA